MIPFNRKWRIYDERKETPKIEQIEQSKPRIIYNQSKLSEYHNRLRELLD